MQSCSFAVICLLRLFSLYAFAVDAAPIPTLAVAVSNVSSVSDGSVATGASPNLVAVSPATSLLQGFRRAVPDEQEVIQDLRGMIDGLRGPGKALSSVD